MRWVWPLFILVGAVIFGLAHDQRVMAQNFQADNALSVFSEIVPANTTPVQICKSPCKVYQVDAFNNGTALAYIKLYNTAFVASGASASACGSAVTPQWRGMIPFGSTSSGGGFSLPWVNGDSYSNGMWMCITGAIGDTDTSTPTSNTFIIDIHFKTISQNNP